MRRDILIAIIGGTTFIIGLVIFFLLRVPADEIVYTNCSSFSSQSEAQEYFLEHKAVHLDGDKDGVACEDLTPTPSQSILRNLIPRPQPNPTPTPVVIEVQDEVVAQPTDTPEAAPTPTAETTPTPTPSVTPQPTPTPSPICNLLPILC